MRKLAEVTDLMAGGLSPALPAASAGLWTQGSNVCFVDKSIRPVPSQLSTFSKLEVAAARGSLEARINGERTFFFGTPGHLYRCREGQSSAEDATRAAGGNYTGILNSTVLEDATLWSLCSFSDVFVVATNGKDVPQLYPLAGKFGNWDTVAGAATGIPATAEIILPIREYLMALNIPLGGNVFAWSNGPDITSAGSWTPSGTNAAGDFKIYQMNSDIIAAVPLGTGVGVYGSDQLFLVEWVGPPFYFGARHLLDGIGALNKNAVVAVGNVHYGICQRGIFRTDGFNIDFIDHPALHEHLFAGIFNENQLAKFFAWHDPTQESVIFFYVGKDFSENSNGVQYNYRNQTWGLLDYGRSSGTSGEIFTHPFLIDTVGNIFQETIEDIAPSIGNSPLTLEPSAASLTTGFGMGGYGCGGYGGVLNVDG